MATKGHFLDALCDPFVANSGARQSPNQCHKSSERATPEPHAKYSFLQLARVATNLCLREQRAGIQSGRDDVSGFRGPTGLQCFATDLSWGLNCLLTW